jgi:O-antigen ligase
LVGANVVGREGFRSLLWPSAVAGLIVALIGILQYHDLAFLGIPTNGHPSSTFGYRNFAAMYLVCALPLAALLFLDASGFAAALLGAVSSVSMATYLVYTRTRGAWIGVGIGVLIVAGFVVVRPELRSAFLTALRPRVARAKIVLLACCALAFAVLAPLPARFQDTGLQRFDEKKADIASALTSVFARHGSRGRTTMWLNTGDLILDHPLIGTGPGGWQRTYPAYDRGAMIRSNTVPARPHNDYLWIASDYGLAGLAVYIWFIMAGFVALLRLGRTSDRFWCLAAPLLAIALLATLGHAAFSFPRERPQAMMFLYLLLGIVAGATSGGRPLGVPRKIGLSLLGLLLVVAVATVGLSLRQIRFDGHYHRALLA